MRQKIFLGRTGTNCCFSILLLFIFPSFAYANAISISNGCIISQNSTADTATIQFDITWENSWRDATNYDAAWVFVKYYDSSAWGHATLSASGTTPSGFSAGSGTSLEIVVPTDKMGCFIQRSETGTGTLTTTSVQIVWDYGIDGLTDNDIADVGLKIFGIEMVYILQGAFYAGDGLSSGCFLQGTGDTEPWYVQSEGAITTWSGTSGSDCYYYQTTPSSGDDASGTIFTISSSFPKGYAAFYLMKYKISQGQYRDFLNTLTKAQQTSRVVEISTGADYAMTSDAAPAFRDSIKLPKIIPASDPVTFGCDLDDNDVFNEVTDGEWVSMNYLSWADVAAFADWAALRPYSELEYEKACRGEDIVVVAGEFAWGSSEMTEAETLSGSGLRSETTSETGAGILNFSGGSTQPRGPLRCGFAATGSTTKSQAGASYYGVMELSGNLYERIVTVGNSYGRNFQASHGDGELDSSGDYTNTDWPLIPGGSGQGLRAGQWALSSSFCRTSDRYYAGLINNLRNNGSGGRCARTAP